LPHVIERGRAIRQLGHFASQIIQIAKHFLYKLRSQADQLLQLLQIRGAMHIFPVPQAALGHIPVLFLDCDRVDPGKVGKRHHLAGHMLHGR
jgi:hypothetical protein